MCQNETYNRVWGGKHWSDMYPIKNGLKKGNALLPLLFNFISDQLVHSDIIVGGSVHTTEKNTEALAVASKEIGLEVNVDTIKQMAMSQDQKLCFQHENVH